ncbi:MAG: phage/plasmid replication protein, II/X family [Clostridia bacterium]|nr:phage/plasmid replication protein, II/X family [Clostridia bacterium]
MAIDTIKLMAYIDEETANKIMNFCTLRQAIDLSTGDCLYEITTGSLAGSYDSRISIKVAKDFEYYVVVECSLHKIILGHNVYGGTDDMLAGVNYLHNFLQNLIGIQFPFCFRKWKLMRIDLAEVFELDCFEAVQEWFKGLNACDYPRRKVRRYGLESICAYGSTTGLKFYHKGVEFWAHDRKRLKNLNYDLFELQEKANRILRTEVEIKARKLKSMYGEYPMIGKVKYADLLNVYDVEVKRFLKEGCNDMKMVRNVNDVNFRLNEMYSDQLAGQLLGTWYRLTTLGEDGTKKVIKKATYYRHVKLLKDAGISWHGTDVVKLENSIVPADFVPVRSDRRRLIGECIEMDEKLNEFRVAVAC